MKFQLRRSCNFNRSREGKSLPEDLIQQVTAMPNFGIQVYFDPFRQCDFRRSWQAPAGDDHFVVNFPGDVKVWKEPFEEVEAAKLRQNNQRG